MRIRIVRSAELWDRTGKERLRLLKGLTLEFPASVAQRLIAGGNAVRIIEAPDPDLGPNGQKWLDGWRTVVGLPFLPSNDYRTWARKSMIEEIDRHFQDGNLVLFEHAVSKLKNLMTA